MRIATLLRWFADALPLRAFGPSLQRSRKGVERQEQSCFTEEEPCRYRFLEGDQRVRWQLPIDCPSRNNSLKIVRHVRFSETTIGQLLRGICRLDYWMIKLPYSGFVGVAILAAILFFPLGGEITRTLLVFCLLPLGAVFILPLQSFGLGSVGLARSS